MKDGRTHLAYKAEHVIDLETELVLASGASVVLFWEPLHRQIRVEGAIERVREGFSREPFVVSADGQSIHASASFGIALLDPDISVEESIDRADKALLMAKSIFFSRAWFGM